MLKNNSIKKMLGRIKSEGINFESCEQKKNQKPPMHLRKKKNH